MHAHPHKTLLTDCVVSLLRYYHQ